MTPDSSLERFWANCVMGLLRIAPKVLESGRKTEHVILSFANGIYLSLGVVAIGMCCKNVVVIKWFMIFQEPHSKRYIRLEIDRVLCLNNSLVCFGSDGRFISQISGLSFATLTKGPGVTSFALLPRSLREW